MRFWLACFECPVISAHLSRLQSDLAALAFEFPLMVPASALGVPAGSSKGTARIEQGLWQKEGVQKGVVGVLERSEHKMKSWWHTLDFPWHVKSVKSQRSSINYLEGEWEPLTTIAFLTVLQWGDKRHCQRVCSGLKRGLNRRRIMRRADRQELLSKVLRRCSH